MNRIRGSLELIRDRLEEYFRNLHPDLPPLNNRWVTLSNLVDHGGGTVAKTDNTLVMFLANIQHETTVSTFQPNRPTRGDEYVSVTPPLYVDLFLLLVANFSDKSYPVGLGIISDTLAFFQQTPTFTRVNLPDLDPRIDKLAFELTNLDLTELNYLLGLAGIRYLPSVYYKIRMIPYTSETPKGTVPAAKGLDTTGDPRDDPGPGPNAIQKPETTS